MIENRKMGRNDAKFRKPTASVEPVSWYTKTDAATVWSQVPMFERKPAGPVDGEGRVTERPEPRPEPVARSGVAHSAVARTSGAALAGERRCVELMRLSAT